MAGDTSPVQSHPIREKRLNRGGRGAAAPRCKTCVSCRRRKSKCDGARPRCGYCARLGRDCSYPQDARSLNKPSRAEMEVLEADLSSLRQIMKNNNISTHELMSRSSSSYPHNHSDYQNGQLDRGLNSPASTSSTGRWADAETARVPESPGAVERLDMMPRENAVTSQPSQGRRRPRDLMVRRPDADMSSAEKEVGPSPHEMSIAGAVMQNGDIEVHGVASVFHRQAPADPELGEKWIASSSERDERNLMSKARLVAYATLQKQREPLLLRGPSHDNIDFDGVDPTLALHLIDKHFNRQHYTYMLTYRPAITDSLINNGPYCNKILLNAIYHSSAVYSDRVELRSDPQDPRTAGDRFHQRLRSVLVDHLEKPDIPTAVGLLLSGAILVSIGRVTAGWMHCGIAYRMIIDLGCHLAVESRKTDNSSETALLTDVELEIRKRLYWGAFSTDATQSLYFGRPPSLRASEARVPRLLLDTYEELEVWMPYVDPQSSSTRPVFASYVPRPSYAISTFNGMVRLMGISSRIVNAFYGIQSLRFATSAIKDLKGEIELELEQWHSSLPGHLRFDPDRDPTFPPHQMTLLTTYHTMQILLRRPFTANGHLSKCFSDEEIKACERISVDSALSIRRLVESYRSTFSLSRAPYLVSYSVYSAIVAILNQNLFPRTQFIDCINFFWAALTELRRGCNFGLQKPIEILRELMHQFGEEIPRFVEGQNREGFGDVGFGTEVETAVPEQPGQESLFWSYNMDTAPELTEWASHDVLYGLFAPSTSLM